MIVEIILRSISTKVWNQAGIELETPGSAIRLATDCAARPSAKILKSNIGITGVF